MVDKLYNSHMIANNHLLLWDCWEYYAKNFPKRQAIIHWDIVGKPFTWTYRGLIEEALSIADSLMRQGVKTGDVCALIFRHNKYFSPSYMAVAAIGAIPAILAYPNPRLHPDKFRDGLSGMAQKSGLDWIMTEKELEPVIKPLVLGRKGSIKGILLPLEWITGRKFVKPRYETIRKSRDKINSNSPFLLQHSSGTTGLQKAVVLSHNSVLEHIKRYRQAIELSENDRIVNWLPLYHDMGLIAAFHMPLACGIPSIQIDPFQWVCAPVILLQAISQKNATLTWLPNFAYNFMADRIREEEMENISLLSMRMFINCSEVVRSESHKKFLNRFRKYGVKKESLAACYALAETTFAVTQTKPGAVVASFTVDSDCLAKGIVRPVKKAQSSKVCISSGRPISGCSIKIVNEKIAELPENRVGTVAIKSASLFNGYRNNPKKTKQVFKNGWYISGDLGFCHNGEYFILGRKDDVIIVAGSNIFPEDIENAINKVKGVIPGRVAAFGVENLTTGTQGVCVVAETCCVGKKDKNILALAIKQAAMNIDVTISMVHLVPPRWLIKSSSGKISRKVNKERILAQIVTQGNK